MGQIRGPGTVWAAQARLAKQPLTDPELEISLLARRVDAQADRATSLRCTAHVETHLSRVLTKCGLRGGRIHMLKERVQQRHVAEPNTG